MTTMYTAIPVREVPYPHGLGKLEYKALENDMKRLLGDRQTDVDTNAARFWDTDYQTLVRRHLAPRFDVAGDIVEIARDALVRAEATGVLGVSYRTTHEARDSYTAALPPRPYHRPPGAAGAVDGWLRNPPQLYRDSAGTLSVGDGRHRLRYLRSLVQPTDPGFLVLVRITTDE
ncbi:hypothetical protein P0W64_21195 [Tsukamurella sp. 8F]|uniref:hypothetical protein n=1 Tax=unclassified Tsukamurella TaxID=2633480 RepID=UPI0023B9D872|nr:MULTISPECIES: hypothetical protein [unclassified Tsukamurella]MDF0532274.1 hypothetical protein [Tsukamurella sp. 8J]MDF0589300.1 hypothetical protein [Tsukamurella sp. 8F]